MRSLFLVSAAVLTLGATGARAQSDATGAERAACGSDALRLCFMHVNSMSEMRSCMISNKDKLSNACRKIVDSRT